MQLLLSLSYDEKLRITVTSSDLPHTKRGAMRDFEDIIETWGAESAFNVNRSALIWTNKRTGATIEFAPFDTVAKAKGPQRDILMIDEANHVSYAIADQLMTRTSKTVFLTYNPSNRFWADEKLIGRKNCKVITTYYKQNPYLSSEQIEEIESHTDPNWMRVYMFGLDGGVKDSVFTNWDIVPDDAMPDDAEHTYYGLDWGFVKDPTAAVKVVKVGEDLYLHQLIYKKGLMNGQIADTLKASGVTMHSRLVCDSAEQKSIAEINTKGLRAVGVRKYPRSIVEGIAILKNYRLHITQSSAGGISEAQSYSYKRHPISDEILDEPEDANNHFWDAVRYVALTYLMPNGRGRRTMATTSRI